MATEKKPTRYLSGKVELKATFSQLRDKKESRGPGQIGQQRNMVTVHLGKIPQPQLIKRLDAAEKILQTGRVPVAVKSNTIISREKTLKKDLDAALAHIVELESCPGPEEIPNAPGPEKPPTKKEEANNPVDSAPAKPKGK